MWNYNAIFILQMLHEKYLDNIKDMLWALVALEEDLSFGSLGARE